MSLYDSQRAIAGMVMAIINRAYRFSATQSCERVGAECMQVLRDAAAGRPIAGPAVLVPANLVYDAAIDLLRDSGWRVERPTQTASDRTVIVSPFGAGSIEVGTALSNGRWEGAQPHVTREVYVFDPHAMEGYRRPKSAALSAAEESVLLQSWINALMGARVRLGSAKRYLQETAHWCNAWDLAALFGQNRIRRDEVIHASESAFLEAMEWVMCVLRYEPLEPALWAWRTFPPVRRGNGCGRSPDHRGL